ncbi:MAG TPA: sigma 54-interacting transcriptional regulator [Actinomycetota bacterium]|nr:sigma 54-interacting transcriptional regulator [Actinomycetota bacterium]
MERPSTLGALRESGFADKTVKQELRDNLLDRLSNGQNLFPSIVGYEDSVLPALERGILAGHDLIFLGERGQAKTRLIRHLIELLDEQAPIVEGCEVNDHPYRPICAQCRAAIASGGPSTPIRWIGRDDRFSEKLATPDTSVGDLIGDVDPIRVAEGRYLSDELAIHYGLVPRTNRGIFSINELPDLPERIQVSLLNILEERDVQIRGFKIRLPLDLLMVASANPEDYTHRGRIISPLKDRFGTQVRTHYPAETSQEIEIMDREIKQFPSEISIHVPEFIKEVLAEFTAQLRRSPQINQRSGVSVRYSIGNLETVIASAVRRAASAGASRAVPRPVDIWPVITSSLGRVEFETMEEGREEQILEQSLKRAFAEVFRRRLGGESFSSLIEKFDQGLQVSTNDLMRGEEFLSQIGDTPGLRPLMQRLGLTEESPEAAASAVEFTLEGLHLMKRLNKSAQGPRSAKFGK